ALRAAYAKVAGLPESSQLGARRVVVLLSDGSPSGGENEQQEAVTLVSQHFAATQPTVLYSVGIGTFPGDSWGYDPKFMSNLAVAGGSAPAGCDPAATDVANV